MTTYAEVLEQLVDVNRRIDAAAKACAEKAVRIRELEVENASLRGALEMVRDADDDCRMDGLPTIPGPARCRIDEALSASLAPLTRLPAGTAVDVTLDDGTVWRTKTRSEPWQLKSGHWLVSLEGKAGGYSLERVRRASE